MTEIVKRLRDSCDRKFINALCEDAALEIVRLRAALGKLQWKSIDKDNMEFQCTITCYVMDEIRAALVNEGEK